MCQFVPRSARQPFPSSAARVPDWVVSDAAFPQVVETLILCTLLTARALDALVGLQGILLHAGQLIKADHKQSGCVSESEKLYLLLLASRGARSNNFGAVKRAIEVMPELADLVHSAGARGSFLADHRAH